MTTTRIENTEGYAFHQENMGELAGTPNSRPVHKLTVEFILDMVPGAWHQPEDLMNWIASHSYVKAVELKEEEDTITVNRQALLDIVRVLDIGANHALVPNALDHLREPFFEDEISSGTARTDGSMNSYDIHN